MKNIEFSLVGSDYYAEYNGCQLRLFHNLNNLQVTNGDLTEYLQIEDGNIRGISGDFVTEFWSNGDWNRIYDQIELLKGDKQPNNTKTEPLTLQIPVETLNQWKAKLEECQEPTVKYTGDEADMKAQADEVIWGNIAYLLSQLTKITEKAG